MSKTKKILIFSHAMEIGGAERALLGLLEAIDTSLFDVDLFLMRHTGELMKYIPKGINLLPEKTEYACLAVPFQHVLLKRKFKLALGRYKGRMASKKKVKELSLSTDNDVALIYSHKYTLPYMPKVNEEEYDLAISFLTPHYFCASKVDAKKKIAWIHTDYSTIDVDIDTEFDMWKQYDQIVSISDRCTDTFLSKFPSLGHKILRIDNIISCEMIIKQSQEMVEMERHLLESGIKLLSIGRFCIPKNFESIPEMCWYIVNSGIDVRWYIIGFGTDEELIRSKIKAYQMEKHVIILGKKENPYPYIKACDIYIQPSKYEGKAVAVQEAQILNKPVIITDFPTASAQLINGYDGVIVPLDNKRCAEGIISVIKNQELQKELINNMKHTNYSNTSEVEKIYQLMGAVVCEK